MIDIKQIILNAGLGEMHQADFLHWDGCEYVHYSCAIKALVDELEATRKERDEVLKEREECRDKETIARLMGELEELGFYTDRLQERFNSMRETHNSLVAERNEYKQKLLIKAVEDTKGIWKDRDDLDALCGIRD